MGGDGGRDGLVSVGGVSAIAAASAAMRTTFGPGVSVCVVVGIILLPVWIASIPRFRAIIWVFVAGGVAICWGLAATFLDTERQSSQALAVLNTLTMVGMLVAAGMLLWSREQIGVGWTSFWFGMGGLLNVAITGWNPANPWKYSLALPITFVVLGLASQRGGRVGEVICLVGLAGVSAMSDSRSYTAFLLIAAAAMMWQMRPAASPTRARPWPAILGLVSFGVGAYYLFQALILDGVIGEAARQRSEVQLDATGSLVTGGRPEMGAAYSLVVDQPTGYGSGTLPSYMDVLAAKSGMSQLNYDPNNKYVEVFMFGGHFEVHSVLGDLWLLFGPVGALLGVFVVGYGIYSTASAISTRTASAALVLLAVLGAWDLLFSPLLSSYRTLALLIALAALPRVSAVRIRQPLQRIRI